MCWRWRGVCSVVLFIIFDGIVRCRAYHSLKSFIVVLSHLICVSSFLSSCINRIIYSENQNSKVDEETKILNNPEKNHNLVLDPFLFSYPSINHGNNYNNSRRIQKTKFLSLRANIPSKISSTLLSISRRILEFLISDQLLVS